MNRTKESKPQHSTDCPTYTPPNCSRALPTDTEPKRNLIKYLPIGLSIIALVCAIVLTYPNWSDSATSLLGEFKEGSVSFGERLESFGRGTSTAFHNSFLQDESTEIESPNVDIIRVGAAVVKHTDKPITNTTAASTLTNATTVNTEIQTNNTKNKQYTASSTFEQEMYNCLLRTGGLEAVVMCEREGTMYFVVDEPQDTAVRYQTNLTIADDRYFVIYEQGREQHILELYP